MDGARWVALAAFGANLVFFFTNGLGHGLAGILAGNVALLGSLVTLQIVATVILARWIARSLDEGQVGRVERLFGTLRGFGVAGAAANLLASELGRHVGAGRLSIAESVWRLLEPRLDRLGVLRPLAVANRMAHLSQVGRYREALELGECVAAPLRPPALRHVRDASALVCNNRASAFVSLGRLDEAEEALAGGFALSPRPAILEALDVNRAWLAFHRGDPGRAVAEAIAFLARTPAPALGGLWGLLLARAGEPDLAMRALERSPAPATDRERFWIEAARGFVLARRGDLASAREGFDRAFALPVPPGASALAAAQLFLEWGDPATASRWLANLRERDPESVWTSTG